MYPVLAANEFHKLANKMPKCQTEYNCWFIRSFTPAPHLKWNQVPEIFSRLYANEDYLFKEYKNCEPRDISESQQTRPLTDIIEHHWVTFTFRQKTFWWTYRMSLLQNSHMQLWIQDNFYHKIKKEISYKSLSIVQHSSSKQFPNNTVRQVCINTSLWL